MNGARGAGGCLRWNALRYSLSVAVRGERGELQTRRGHRRVAVV
jgi:hypothetical protein